MAEINTQPRILGPYLLRKHLGSGGMGDVYLAERVDGEITQTVAVKLLQPGTGDTEREVLARLSHPNIARLLDAGHSEQGQPYLVMEFVDGQPLDAWAAGRGAPEKIALFLKVCDAVAYLHRNLVIHRDLKPSNILVTNDNEPKLLDFGVAKMQDATADSPMLTPEYSSPEQLAGAAANTSTDIYSLGAVLRRILGTIKGDLNAVTMKALRPEPSERYATVEQFADDLKNVLESRPVRARKGDSWYRAKMFMRRYRVAVGVTFAIAIALAAGLLIVRHQRAVEQRRFAAVRQFMSKLVGLEVELKSLPSDRNARAEVASAALEYLATLEPEVHGDKDFALEVATAYWRVAGIQHYTLGQLNEAEESLRRGNNQVAPLLAKSPDDPRLLLSSASIAHDRATLADSRGDHEKTLSWTRTSAAQFDRLVAMGKLDPKDVSIATRCYHNLAIQFLNAHLYPDAIHCARTAADISRDDPALQKDRSLAFGVLANCLRQTGDLEGALAAIRQSRALLETAPDRATMHFSYLSAALWREGLILGEDGDINLGRQEEAVAVLQRDLDLTERVAKNNPSDHLSRRSVAAAARQLANILRHSDPRRALAIYDQAIARIREGESTSETRRAEASLLANSSYALRWLHRESEAKSRIDSGFKLLAQEHLYPADAVAPSSETDTALRALADHLFETGNAEEAAGVYSELLHKLEASHPDELNDLKNATYMSRTYAAMVPILRRLHRSEEAEAMDARRVALWNQWDHKLPHNSYVRRQLGAA